METSIYKTTPVRKLPSGPVTKHTCRQWCSESWTWTCCGWRSAHPRCHHSCPSSATHPACEFKFHRSLQSSIFHYPFSIPGGPVPLTLATSTSRSGCHSPTPWLCLHQLPPAMQGPSQQGLTTETYLRWAGLSAISSTGEAGEEAALERERFL